MRQQIIVRNPGYVINPQRYIVLLADSIAFHLLLLQLLVAVAMLACSALVSERLFVNLTERASFLHPTVIAGYLFKNPNLLLSAICLAAFFPLWLQAILHFENLTALLMLSVSVSCLQQVAIFYADVL
jgi:hypothetical protein